MKNTDIPDKFHNPKKSSCLNFANTICEVKNPRFLPNQADIQAILPTHELNILTKFHIDWVKTVDFLFLLFPTSA